MPLLLARDTHGHLPALSSFHMVLEARRSRREMGLAVMTITHSSSRRPRRLLVLLQNNAFWTRQSTHKLTGATLSTQHLYKTKPVNIPVWVERGLGEPTPSIGLLAVRGCNWERKSPFPLGLCPLLGCPCSCEWPTPMLIQAALIRRNDYKRKANGL